MQKAQKEKAQEKEKRRCACGREIVAFWKKLRKNFSRGLRCEHTFKHQFIVMHNKRALRVLKIVCQIVCQIFTIVLIFCLKYVIIYYGNNIAEISAYRKAEASGDRRKVEHHKETARNISRPSGQALPLTQGIGLPFCFSESLFLTAHEAERTFLWRRSA